MPKAAQGEPNPDEQRREETVHAEQRARVGRERRARRRHERGERRQPSREPERRRDVEIHGHADDRRALGVRRDRLEPRPNLVRWITHVASSASAAPTASTKNVRTWIVAPPALT